MSDDVPALLAAAVGLEQRHEPRARHGPDTGDELGAGVVGARRRRQAGGDLDGALEPSAVPFALVERDRVGDERRGQGGQPLEQGPVLALDGRVRPPDRDLAEHGAMRQQVDGQRMVVAARQVAVVDPPDQRVGGAQLHGGVRRLPEGAHHRRDASERLVEVRGGPDEVDGVQECVGSRHVVGHTPRGPGPVASLHPATLCAGTAARNT